MSEFYEGMAEIFEVDSDSINGEFDLHSVDVPWDSLAIVMTIALVDNCFNVMLDGKALLSCTTVGDIESLIKAAQKS